MEADIALVLSFLSDSEKSERFQHFLHTIFEYPRRIISNVLTKMDELLTEDVVLRQQHRQFSQMLKKNCMTLLAYIGAVEILCSMCDSARKDLILVELVEQQHGERFDKTDKLRFPQTIDFLEELDLNLEKVKQKLRDVKKCCQTLYEKSSNTSADAQKSESDAKFLKYSTRAAGLLAVAGGVLLSGGLGLLVVGGGALGGYLVSNELSLRERSLYEGKMKMDNIHKMAYELESIADKVEVMRDHSTLDLEHENVLRPNPLLMPIKSRMEKLLCILTAERNFDNEKRDIHQLITKSERFHENE